MERNKIVIPKGIRYISEWKDFDILLPHDSSYIMNKSITGCGYTEYCIRNEFPEIICSPRKVLLENKENQHSDEENILYIKDEYATFQSYDDDMNQKVAKSRKKSKKENEEETKNKAKEYNDMIRNKILDHAMKCQITYHKPAKFLVTYDSFRKVREALGDGIRNYRVVVDEFQSIFTDSRFKSDTENSFLHQLRDLNNVCYLSATPMMDEYLEELDEFKNLPYYELDWKSEDPDRVVRPNLKLKQIRSISEEAVRIVNTYKEGKFERITRLKDDGTFEEIYSKEAVFYINSVKNLCDIIRYCKLTPDDTNVLCSDDTNNQKKVRDAFRSVDDTLDKKRNYIGTVPKKGEPHKMFTLCTRTVYLGADFYSTNARSFILSDANIDCLSVDISLDLPQILGRQRLDENPWKNYAEFYYKTNMIEVSQDEFQKLLDKKIEKTNTLLGIYNGLSSTNEKHTLADTYQYIAISKRYKDDFVAVDQHAGSDLKPVFNKLVMISEKRAFDIQQKDYKDRFTVFKALDTQSDIDDLNSHLDKIYSFGGDTREKYKYLCELPEQTALSILPSLPSNFQNYYTVLGPDRMRALWYNVTKMKKEYDSIIGNQGINIRSIIQGSFSIGERITKAEVKKRLGEIYDIAGYKKTPKAVDLGEYFIINTVDIKNEKTGKRDKGYLIVDIKKGDS